MTDHLEPYRRMARSIRFFPPASLRHLSQKPVTLATSVVTSSPKQTLSQNNVSLESGPPINPSEHVAALVHEAVSQPTVLPASYTILENIGDRISRLATSKPVEPYIIQPKIPQPDPNGLSAEVSPPREAAIDLSERAAALVREAVSQPTVLPASYTILENIGDRISRLTAPAPVDADTIAPKISQPDAEGTDANPIEPHPEEVDPKKSLDDAHLEASASPTVGTEAPTVEETSSDNFAGVVVEPWEDDEASAGAIVAPVAVEETPDDTSQNNSPADAVTEPIAVAETTSDNIPETDTSVTETEGERAPTLMERVSSVVEAVATAFKNPDTAPKDSETVVEPSPIESAVTEAPVAEPVEALTVDTPASEAETTKAPNLLERVSSVVEAVTTTLKDSDADKKNAEAAVESPPAADATVSERKTLDITCPKCQSTAIRKNGRRQGKQRFVCKDCGREFATPDPAKAEDQPKIKASSPTEVSKVKSSQSDTAPSDSSPESSKHQSKKKTKAKGFGSPKAN